MKKIINSIKEIKELSTNLLASLLLLLLYKLELNSFLFLYNLELNRSTIKDFYSYSKKTLN